MTITVVGGRILQAIEFWRSGAGRWFVKLWQSCTVCKVFLLPFLAFALAEFYIHMFTLLAHSIADIFNVARTNVGNGVHSGGVELLAMANAVLPLDETIALLIIWVGLYSATSTIRFFRAAWAAIPLKAT